MVDRNPKSVESEIKDRNSCVWCEMGLIAGLIVGFFVCGNRHVVQDRLLGESLLAWLVCAVVATLLGGLIDLLIWEKGKKEICNYKYEYERVKKDEIQVFEKSSITEEIAKVHIDYISEQIKKIRRNQSDEWIYVNENIRVGESCAGYYDFTPNRVKDLDTEVKREAFAEVLGRRIVNGLKKRFPMDPAGGQNTITYSMQGSDIEISYKARNGNFIKARSW